MADNIDTASLTALITEFRRLQTKDSISPEALGSLLQRISFLLANAVKTESFDSLNRKVANLDHPVEVNDIDDADLVIADEYSSPILSVQGGHVKTRKFDSSAIAERLTKAVEDIADIYTNLEHPVRTADTANADFVIADDDENPIVTFKDGHLKTAKFDSERMFDVSLLSIGNSFSRDNLAYLPKILEALIPNVNVTMCIAYKGGCTLEEHLSFISLNSASYVLSRYETKTGHWTTDTVASRISDALGICQWKYIVLQQQSQLSKDFSSYEPYIDGIIHSLFSRLTYPVKLGWLLTPALPDGNANLDGMTSDEMHSAICSSVKQLFAKHPFEMLFPCGTAIQNARHAGLDSIGQYGHLTYDGLHLQEGIAPMTAGYAAALPLLNDLGINKSLFGEKSAWATQSWIEDLAVPEPNGASEGVSNANVLIAQKCAIASNKDNFNITEIN